MGIVLPYAHIEAFCRVPEANVTPYVNFTSIKKKGRTSGNGGCVKSSWLYAVGLEGIHLSSKLLFWKFARTGVPVPASAAPCRRDTPVTTAEPPRAPRRAPMSPVFPPPSSGPGPGWDTGCLQPSRLPGPSGLCRLLRLLGPRP